MSSLRVPKIDGNIVTLNYATLQQKLEMLPWNNLPNVNWPEEYPDKPIVNFQIAHSGESIFLHYVVDEDFVKAQYVRPNEAVWEDSCVEFFVSFDERKHYYNLEFNVLGTGLIGYGTEVKSERQRLRASLIETVQTVTFVVHTGGKKTWGIVLIIPVSVFTESSIARLDGVKAHANFYKCGDGLPKPHFISWSKIDYPTPNFHLPAFFGDVIFE